MQHNCEEQTDRSEEDRRLLVGNSISLFWLIKLKLYYNLSFDRLKALFAGCI